MSRPLPIRQWLRHAVTAALLVGGPTLLVMTGILGYGRGRSEQFEWDMAVVYFAGKLLWSGQNPYDHEALRALLAANGVEVANGSFAYPPQALPIAMLLASGELAQARFVWCALNLLAVAGISALVVRMLGEVSGRRVSALAIAFVVAVIFGNPFTSHVVWLGQTSLIVTAAIMLGFALATRGADGRAALALGFSTFKPTLSLLPTFWWLLRGRYRLCLGIGVVSLLLAAYPLLVLGPFEILESWRENLRLYRTFRVNRLGDRDVLGIESAFAALGIWLPMLLPLELLATGLLVRWRARFHPYEVLALLSCAAMLFSSSHAYDLVALAPVLAVRMPVATRSAGRMLFGLGLLGALCFPARWVDASGIPPLSHWRDLVVLAIALWILVEPLQRREVCSR